MLFTPSKRRNAMEFEHRIEHNIVITPIQGELVQGAVADFRKYVNECMEAKYFKGFIFNLNGLTHIDSYGVGELMGLANELQKRRQKMVLCELNSHFMKLFQMIALNEVIKIFRTEKDALAGVWDE